MELYILRELRKRHYTRQYLADEMGVSQPTVSQWLNNKRMPPIDVLAKIADVIGCPITAFFQEDEDEDRDNTIVCPHCHKAIQIEIEIGVKKG